MDWPSLRPLDLSDLLDESLGLYRRDFGLFAGIVAVLAVPEAVTNAILTVVEPTATVRLANGVTETVGTGPWYSALAVALTAGFAILTSGALALAVSYRYLGKEITIAEAYRSVGTGRFVTLFLGAMVLTFAVAVALISVVGWIVLVVRWLFLPQAIVLEGTSAIGGLRRSWHLTRGSFWRVFGYAIVIFLIIAILQLALGGLIAAALSVAGPSGARVLGQLLGAAVNVLVRPFGFITLTLLYYDLRVRNEGFDLEVMTGALGVWGRQREADA